MDISVLFNKKPKQVKEKSHKRFNEWSDRYDRSILHFLMFGRSYDMFLRNIVSDYGKKRILDVGCGTGEFALRLKDRRKDLEIYGMDLSNEMIQVARQKVRPYCHVDFRVGDVEELPYEDNYFDCLTCSHSFHHYPNKKKAVREMYRVLRPEGTIMIIDGCKDNAIGKFIFDFIIKRHEVNVHHLSKVQFRKVLSLNGFKEIDQTIFNPLIPLLLTKGTADKENICASL